MIEDMRPQQVYTFTIEDRDELPMGIFLRRGEDWVLVHLISDFMLDGYELISARHILHSERSDREIFVEEVLKVNNRWHTSHKWPHIDLPLDTPSLFKYLDDTSLIFFFSPKDDNVGYVGYVDRVTSKSFFMRKMDTHAIWDEWVEMYRISTPRKFHFATDYLESLMSYYRIFGEPTAD